MNTKAQIFDVARKTVFWLVISFFIAMIMGGTAYAFGSYRKALLEIPPDLPSEFISLRFVNNPACFAYLDPRTNTVQSNSIDISKFTQEQLDNCYSTPSEKGYKEHNFRLVLQGASTELKTNNYYFDGRDDFILEKEVTLYDSGTTKRGILVIYVQEKIGS